MRFWKRLSNPEDRVVRKRSIVKKATSLLSSSFGQRPMFSRPDDEDVTRSRSELPPESDLDPLVPTDLSPGNADEPTFASDFAAEDLDNLGTKSHNSLTNVTANQHHDESHAHDHGDVTGLGDDDHPQYTLADGTRDFTGVVVGVDPTLSEHLATKEYVDKSVSFIADFYLNDTASDIGGIYYVMKEDPTGEAESTFTTAGLGTGDDQALTNWATLSGVPGVNNLKAGLYSAHVHAEKTAGTKPAKIYFAIYTRAAGGAETLRATSEISDYVTSKASVNLHATLAEDVDILITDRIVIKWFANVEAAGSNATIVFYAEGTNSARASIPTGTEVLSSVFVRIDEVDDTPVNGETAAPISSNWAYDHDADVDAHHAQNHAASHTDGSDDIQNATDTLKGIAAFNIRDFIVVNGVVILALWDSNFSHRLSLIASSNLSEARSLSFATGDADRILTIGGNASIDQDTRVAGSPTFVAVTVQDLIASASLKLPTAANPTVDAEGEAAWDSTDDQLIVNDGAAVRQIPSTFEVDRTIFFPNFVNDKIPLFHCDASTFPNGAKITKLSITLPADAAYSMPFEEWSGDPPTEDAVIETVTTAATDAYMAVSGGAIDNPDLEAGDYIFVDVPATAVDWIHVKVIGYRKGPP